MVNLNAASSLSAKAMLAQLVRFDTTSHKSNLDLIGFLRAWLDAHEVPYRLSFDATGEKANLHAILGPVQPGGLAFSGHLDTVSANGQAWTGDPFTLRQENCRLIGRGTCDMKGFVAAVLSSVPAIKHLKLTKPMHLLLTYDEEVGYHGARRLITDIEESGLRPAACVVGEASGMMPITANKGRVLVRVGVRGFAAHSSNAHQGVNAAHAAAEAIAWIASEARQRAHTGPIEAGFDPPYTTVQVTNVSCEILPNTIPGRANFDLELRNIPADNPTEVLARFQRHVGDEIEPGMHALRTDTGFDYETILELAALSLPQRHELAQAVSAITGASTGGKVSYCSEGSLYQPTGIACLICGPGHITQVHQPDEWITESQLASCENFIRRLVGCMLL